MPGRSPRLPGSAFLPHRSPQRWQPPPLKIRRPTILRTLPKKSFRRTAEQGGAVGEGACNSTKRNKLKATDRKEDKSCATIQHSQARTCVPWAGLSRAGNSGKRKSTNGFLGFIQRVPIGLHLVFQHILRLANRISHKLKGPLKQ